MKLTCMAQCYNENTHKGVDGKTNLKRFLDSIVKYCDSLVLYDDASIDNSKDLARTYRDRFEDFVLIEGKENSFDSELAHKQQSLEKCREIGSTHVLWLDCDEVIEKRGEQGGIRSLCESMSKGAVNFFQRNLWRTDRYYRADELWAQGLFCRLWKLNDSLCFDVKTGLHHDLAPKGIEGRETTQLKVIHYGFATSDDILRKYYLYKTHGQKGRALNRLIDESTLRVVESNPNWFDNSDWPHGREKEVFLTPLRSML